MKFIDLTINMAAFTTGCVVLAFFKGPSTVTYFSGGAALFVIVALCNWKKL